MPLTIRSLTVTHEEAALLRAAAETLRTSGVLSTEGHAVLADLTPRLDDLLARFPAGHPGVLTQDEADHRDRMVAILKGEASR